MKVSLGCHLEWLPAACLYGVCKISAKKEKDLAQPVQHLLIKMSCQRERLFVCKCLLSPAATPVVSIHPPLTSAPTSLDF